jgi:hypothetical protein
VKASTEAKTQLRSETGRYMRYSLSLRLETLFVKLIACSLFSGYRGNKAKEWSEREIDGRKGKRTGIALQRLSRRHRPGQATEPDVAGLKMVGAGSPQSLSALLSSIDCGA